MSLTLLSLRDFKCHTALDLPLAPFTILTGLNSAGKSTVCQALAFLAQSLRAGKGLSPMPFPLNGDLVCLGCMGDVLNQMTDQDCFSITLRDDNIDLALQFSGDRRDTKALLKHGVVRYLNGQHEESFTQQFFQDPHSKLMATLLLELEYLTILRSDPAEVTYRNTVSEPEVRIKKDGDGTVAVLYLRDQTKVHEQLCMQNVPPTLPRQAEAWMEHFFPGFAMDIQPADSAMDILTLRIRTDRSGEFHLPGNVGYGPYYALPVVTAALVAQPGSLLIFDSPEAHLHPKCQNAMAGFLATVAKTGVQILVETHNDHFINGVRQAVKSDIIPADSTIVHYFGDATDAVDTHRHSTISIDAKGSLDHWPEGFCDQYERDLANLTEWK